MQQQDIDNRFDFHPVKSEADKTAHEEIRAKAKALAEFINLMVPEGREKALVEFINLMVPEGREKSLAVTHLEEAMFWSNAAIARARPRE